MSRYFMIQSWVGSHENEPDYNGQQCGERNVRSIEAVPLYDQFGNANVSAFSDEAIAARSGVKKPTISLADRVLPQQRRIIKLTNELIELEAAKKAGIYSLSEYSLLRDILVAKRQRTEELLKKARSLKPKSYEPEEEHYEDVVNDRINTESYEIPASATTGVSHKGNDVERKDAASSRHSWVKLRINVPRDLIYFATGSIVFLMVMKIIF